MRRLGALALASLVHLAHAGCGGPPAWPELPPPPSEEERAAFGTVGVRAIEDPLDADLAPPVHGFCSTTGYYTLVGAAIGMMAGGAVLGGLGRSGSGGGWAAALVVFFAVLLAAALIAGGTVIGSLYGAIDSINHPEVDRGIAALRRAALETGLAGRVAAGLGLSLDPDADTVLELGPPSAVLHGPWRKDDLPLGLAGALPARLVRASDRKVLWQASFAFRAEGRRFAEWSAREGAALRDALSAAAPDLARRIREEAFELHFLPERPLR